MAAPIGHRRHRGVALVALLLAALHPLGLAAPRLQDRRIKVAAVSSMEKLAAGGRLQRDPREVDEVEQCFGFTAGGYSIAREDFDYVDIVDNFTRKHGKKGELIRLRCDGVVCPNPQVLDCYHNEGICGPDHWCMLQDHIRFGPYAMSPAGETPNIPVGAPGVDCVYLRKQGYDFLYNEVCNGQDTWGPWRAVRGRCVPYRKEQQSCSPHLSAQPESLVHYVVSNKDGRPLRRPMVCAPGLVCTGDVEPTPFTCVRKRPPNICYQGSWWDSMTWCKVGGSKPGPDIPGGLPREVLEDVAQSLLLQLPVEIYASPSNPAFWNATAAKVSRRKIQDIVKALWPAPYMGLTRFPLSTPDPYQSGPEFSTAWNETVELVHQKLYQANAVWSTIHSLIHNMADPMTGKAAQASQALAIWLRQHFWCANCRGFWAGDVLNVVGLPPSSTNREDHKFWWWRAHNMVSEHAAATRGGHPWIWLSADSNAEFKQQQGSKYSELLKCQNPFFLPFEEAGPMWDIVDLA